MKKKRNRFLSFNLILCVISAVVLFRFYFRPIHIPHGYIHNKLAASNKADEEEGD